MDMRKLCKEGHTIHLVTDTGLPVQDGKMKHIFINIILMELFMNIRYCLLTFIVFCCSLIVLADNSKTQNLLPNSSFEESPVARETYPVVGEYRSFSDNNWQIDSKEKYDGSQSLCIFGKKPFYWQILSGDSTKNVFSVYLKSAKQKQQIKLGFELLSFCDDGGVTIEGKKLKVVTIDNTWKRYNISSNISSKNKRNWVAPHIFRIWIRPVSNGKFWVDAVQFEKNRLIPGKFSSIRFYEKLFHPSNIYISNPRYRKLLQSPVELKISKTTGGSGKVPLSVVETEGRSWESEPVWGGVPFPKGELFDENKVCLYDENGQQIPIQAKVLSRRHIDGSVTSLLVNFQTTVKPYEKKKFVLAYGKPGKVVNTALPMIKDDGDKFIINTGAVLAEVPKTDFTIFGKISDLENKIMGNRNNSGSYSVDATGKIYCSGNHPPESINIEMNGPIHGVICAKGKHYDPSGKKFFLNYEVRIHAFADKDYFLIQYTIENHNPSLNTTVRTMFMRFPVYITGKAMSEKWLGNNGITQTYHIAPEQRLLFTQLHDYYGKGKYELAVDNYEKRWRKTEFLKNVKAPGWAQVGKSCIRVENFWQMNPKAIEISKKYIGVYMWPNRYVRYLDLPSGISNTMNIYYRPLKRNSSRILSAKVSALLLQADPKWVANTGVFGHFIPEEETAKSFPFYNRRIGSFFDSLAKRPEQEDLTGMFDYGEIGLPNKWMNNETTVLRCLLTQYLRTGKPDIFYRAQNLMRHLRDVDTCHWGNLRLMHHPSAGIHTTYWFGPAHFWITGLIWYYWLTGDMRTYEVAKELGTMLVAWSGKAYEGRNRSRMLFHLAELYDLTHLKCFREAFERQYNHGRPTEINGKYNRDYYGGTGLSAIMRMYETTGESKYLARLKKEWNELYLLRANGLPGYRVEGDRGWCLFTALAEAAKKTGNRKFIEGFFNRMIWFLVSTHGFGPNAARGAEFLAAARKLNVPEPKITPEYLAGIDILTGKTPRSEFVVKVIKKENFLARIKLYRARLFRAWRYPKKSNDVIKYLVTGPDGKQYAKGTLAGKEYLCHEITLDAAAPAGEYTVVFECLNNGQGAISYSSPEIFVNADNWFRFRRDRGTTAFVKFYFLAPRKKNHIVLKYRFRQKPSRKTRKSNAVSLENASGKVIASERWLNPLGTECDKNGEKIDDSPNCAFKLKIPKQYQGKVLSITITASKGVWQISGLNYPWLAANPQAFQKVTGNTKP